MGLLDKILGHDVAWFLKKAKKYADNHDLGEALHLVNEAEKIAKTDAENNDIKDVRNDIEHRTYLLAVEQTKEYLRGHMHQNVQNSVDRALRYAHNEEEARDIISKHREYEALKLRLQMSEEVIYDETEEKK